MHKTLTKQPGVLKQARTALQLVVLIAAIWISAASAAVNEPSYVIFSIMGPQGFGPQIINGIVRPEDGWDSVEKEQVEDIRKQFGEQRSAQQKYIGFSIALTPTLNLKPEELKAQVVKALNLAESNSIPVFFHLDDQHFWWLNTELSHNPAMQEWSEFPKAGETSGRVVPRYWLNWGDPASVYPTPPPCFACQPFRAALAKRLRECVAEPIVQRLSTWRKQGKDYLFAGMASGNETMVPDFSRGYDGYKGKEGDEAGSDMTRFPPVRLRMSKEDMVPIGYHSLYAMGYNQSSIERLAQSQQKNVRRVTHELLYKVAHDYAEFQAKTLCEAGVPKERIYTHFTSTNHSLKSYEQDQIKDLEARPTSAGRAGSDNVAPPVESSINRYSRPGFTVVSTAVDLNELVAQMRKAGAPQEGKAWAAVESYACSGQPGTPQSKEQYEEYLGGLIAHGAHVVNIYGWNIPSGPYAIKSSGVVPAVKKWLSGERIPSNWSGSGASQVTRSEATAIQAKIAKLQELAHYQIDHGRDPHVVSAILESFQREFESQFNAGKISEAEAAINRANLRLQTQK